MRFLSFIVLTFFLCACAPVQNSYQNQDVTYWRGKSANTLTQQLGQPTRITKASNNNTYYSYTTYERRHPPAPVQTMGVHVSKTGKPVMVMVSQRPAAPTIAVTCVTTYEINSAGNIISVHSEGYSCPTFKKIFY